MGTPTKMEISEVLAKAMNGKKYLWEREGHILYVVEENRINHENRDILHLFRLENRNSRSNPPLPLRVSKIEIADALNLGIQCFLCPYLFIDKIKNSLLYQEDENLQAYLKKCMLMRERLDTLEKETKKLRASIMSSGTVYLQRRSEDNEKKPTVWCFNRFINRTLTSVECHKESDPNNIAVFKLTELKQYGT